MPRRYFDSLFVSMVTSSLLAILAALRASWKVSSLEFRQVAAFGVYPGAFPLGWTFEVVFSGVAVQPAK